MTPTRTALAAPLAWLICLGASSAAWAAPAAPAPLSLADRVACQRAVDQVYWRHRSEAGAGPRLAFDQAVPEAVSRRKAEDAVRKSVALAQWWNTTLTPAQLQAELDRMAASSQSPAVLAELLAALGHDPQRAAECLARPALADRLIQGYFAQDERFQGAARRQARIEWRSLRGGGAAASAERRDTHWVNQREAALAAGSAATLLSPEAFEQRLKSLRRAEGGRQGQPVLGQFGPLREDDRRIYALAIDALDAQQVKLRSVSWRKPDFDRWWQAQRGQLSLSLPAGSSSGAVATAGYTLPQVAPDANCRDDSWKPTLAGLDGRYEHTAVWTGSEMLVWGGAEAVGVYFNDGSRYNPATDTWTPMSMQGAPSARHAFSSAWTGQELVVLGGTTDRAGGRYDPVTDTWRPTSTVNAPTGRLSAASVWTGKELIIWGGDDGAATNTGSRYNPKSDTWQTMSASPLAPRAYMPAVWTGSEMVIWSGYNVHIGQVYRDGARYNPKTGLWTPISLAGAPAATLYHSAVWTGQEVLVWGGATGETGHGRYDPASNSWRSMSAAGAPVSRYAHNAVWTGSEMLVQGGWPAGGSGGRYDPASDRWTLMSATNAPPNGQYGSLVWTGTEALAWGGLDENFGYRNDGARYRLDTDQWLPMTSMNVPSARGYHSAEWTGAEMVVWGGYGSMPTDRGARFDPATNHWSPMSSLGQPMPRQNATSVWTGSEIIYWGGGTTDPFTPDTGGRYNPATDSWQGVSRQNAPFSTYGHTAVWTGSEMITYGGISSNLQAKRYNPVSNTWTNATRTGDPGHRDHHGAVWTGTEMIIWGGSIDDGELGPRGGRYNPATNSWVRIPRSAGQPQARAWPVTVWTGTEMIVWGGYDYLYTVEFGDGGRYNPATGGWTPTSLSQAPSPRIAQGVWTGSEMIVWGGDNFGTGARYRPASDSWTPTTQLRAPAPLWGGRWSTVWTGSQMIIWGGLGPTQKGGMYCASGLPNTAPVAVADQRRVRSGKTLVNSAANSVLKNDSDANGDALSARLLSGPAHGSLKFNANGSFRYTPAAGFTGSDSFRYVANDDLQDSAPVPVQIEVR